MQMKCCHHCEHHASCIEHVPIFASLSRDERLETTEIASSRSFEKGETVYRAGDEGRTLFVLYTGRAKLFRLNASGRNQVLRVVEPRQFIGELSLFFLPLTDNVLPQYRVNHPQKSYDFQGSFLFYAAIFLVYQGASEVSGCINRKILFYKI